jgi:sialate O-acetylesterase
MLNKLIFYILFLIVPFFAKAQLQLAKSFSDNMVLQRDQPINIWGKASPREIVKITFSNQKKIGITQADSSWNIVLNKQETNSRPQTITITCGKEVLNIRNVLIGDVWLCIGQSNMEFPLLTEAHYTTELKNLDLPLLRFYNPIYPGKNVYKTQYTDSLTKDLLPQKFYKGQWQNCDTNSIKTMSAVAYYFGKQVCENEQIPIGLLNLSIGGAALESFISVESLNSSLEFSAKVNGDWLVNKALPDWIRERGKQNVGGLLNIPKDINGNNHSYKPGFAFEAGILPLIKMPIKGVLCYQGESNAQELDRVLEYGNLTELMINDFRNKWNQPNLPFYYVQISSMDTLNYKSQFWPEFRDEQRKTLSLIQNVGMAVSSDLGFLHDVHPTNKKAIGERLARWALKNNYHKKIIPSGPLPISAKYKDGKIIIRFQYANNGLFAADNNIVKGFSVDGINEIPVQINKSSIIIAVNKKPNYVYYGWKPFTNANLINKEWLPTSTFKLLIQ